MTEKQEPDFNCPMCEKRPTSGCVEKIPMLLRPFERAYAWRIECPCGFRYLVKNTKTGIEMETEKFLKEIKNGRLVTSYLDIHGIESSLSKKGDHLKREHKKCMIQSLSPAVIADEPGMLDVGVECKAWRSTWQSEESIYFNVPIPDKDYPILIQAMMSGPLDIV